MEPVVVPTHIDSIVYIFQADGTHGEMVFAIGDAIFFHDDFAALTIAGGINSTTNAKHSYKIYADIDVNDNIISI